MNPRTIILGVTIVYFIVMAVRVERWRQQVLQAGIAMRPNHLLDVPFWLIVATLMLLIRRWWTELLAILVCGNMLYMGYVDLRGNPFVSDLDPSYRIPWRIWLAQKYAFQPQELLEIALAFLIVGYALVSLSRRLLRPRVDVKPVKTG
jgi:hypothetical protein